MNRQPEPLLVAILFAVVGFAIVIPTALLLRGMASAAPVAPVATLMPSDIPFPTATLFLTATPPPTPPATVTQAPTSTSIPFATAVPALAPTATPEVAILSTLVVSGTPIADIDNSSRAAINALNGHISQTVCSPAARAANPIPRWCDAIMDASAVDGVLLVRTNLTRADHADLTAMLGGLSSFVYNNNYKQYGLFSIDVRSTVDDATIARRRGLAYYFEYP